MSKLEELQEKKNSLAIEIRQHAEKFQEKQEWPDAEAKQNWDNLNADYDSVVAQLDAENQAKSVQDRLTQIDDLQTGPATQHHNIGRDDAIRGQQGGRQTIGSGATTVCTDEHRSLALAGWMKNQLGEDVSEKHQEAAALSGLNLNRKVLNFASAQDRWINGLTQQFRSKHASRVKDADFYNAPLTTQTGSSGGNVIPPEELLRSLEINMLAFGGMGQVAEMMITERGEPLTWPTADDTGNTGVQIGENTNLDSSGSGGPIPTFAKVQWDAYKLSSQAILVPYELIEDNVVNLVRVIGEMAGERIGRFRNARYTTGTGTDQATGIITASSVGVTAASATAIDPDELIDLQHSIDPAYRMGAGFMMHDSIVAELRQLKQDNKWLWQPGMETGVPDRILGAPVTINQDMDSSLAASNKTILYGQLSKYKIRRVNGFRMYRLEERYRDSDQDGFILLVREDGNLLDAGTAPVKFLQMAAA